MTSITQSLHEGEMREIIFEETWKEVPLLLRIFTFRNHARFLFNSGYLCRLKEEKEELEKKVNDVKGRKNDE